MKKKSLISLMIILMVVGITGCEKKIEKPVIKPEEARLKTICDLATMECYYHNVAKYEKPEASGYLWWKKDRRFWVEYSGVVVLGIDTSQVNMQIDGSKVRITIPEAEVLRSRVHKDSLTEESFYVDPNSAKVDSDDQTEAFKDAQAKMEEEARSDKVLLANAQQRAKELLESYINNLGDESGIEYEIEWEYLGEDTKKEK